MSHEPERTFYIFVEPVGHEAYIETSTDALGHALIMLDDMGKAPGIPSMGQQFLYSDRDELRIEDDEDLVIKVWSREKGVIYQFDLSDDPDGNIIGWQIVNADGVSIRAGADDPFDLTSFAILVGPAAKAARDWVAENPGYTVAPVRTGDIENPEFVADVTRRPAPERAAGPRM